jgi:hypothetical protein
VYFAVHSCSYSCSCVKCVSFSCLYTYYHSNSYVYPNFEDAVAIAEALNASNGLASRTTPSPRRSQQYVGTSAPGSSSLPRQPPSTQPVFRSTSCSAVGCLAVANRDCKDKLCKACCRLAIEQARVAGTSRSRCTAHKLPGVEAAAPLLTQATQVHAPHPATQAPPQRPVSAQQKSKTPIRECPVLTVGRPRTTGTGPPQSLIPLHQYPLLGILASNPPFDNWTPFKMPLNIGNGKCSPVYWLFGIWERLRL